jgi:hypothetical protein
MNGGGRMHQGRAAGRPSLPLEKVGPVLDGRRGDLLARNMAAV